MNEDKQEKCGTQPDLPTVKDHINDNRRRNERNADRIELLFKRVNKLEAMLGVCFDEPPYDLDIEDLSFRE